MNEDIISESIKNLIIVPGHAVYIGTTREQAYFGQYWVGTYAGYRYDDEVPLYVRHIQRGVNLAVVDSSALLIFSGGKTRQSTQMSEAESYSILAQQMGWFGEPSVSQRVRLEEYATDSFENLLFSIQLFKLLHPSDKFPRRVTVVGLRFKKQRYEQHAHVIISTKYKGIPPFVFRYDDVNDIPDYVFDGGSGEGEELTRLQFRLWPYGDQGELIEKRQSRDPWDWYQQRPYD